MLKFRSMAVVLLVALSALTLTTFNVKILVVENGFIERIPVRDGDEVTLSFIHSAELSPWVEIYEVKGDSLVLKRALTQSTGWGLPSVEGNFSFVEFNGQKWMAFEIKRKFRILRISALPSNNYTLSVDGKVIKLGNEARVRIEDVSLANYLAEVLTWKSRS